MFNRSRNCVGLLCIAILLAFFADSCRKSESAPVYPYLSLQVYPYDTTLTDGMFMLEESYTPGSAFLPVSGYATFFHLPGAPQRSYAKAALINAGWETKDYDNGFRVTGKINGATYWTGPLTWLIRNNNTDSVYYTDSTAFPYFSCTIPDTFTKTGLSILFIDSMANADSILCFGGNLDHSAWLIKNYISPRTNNIAFDFSSSDWPVNKEIYIGIVAFTHHYATINGKRYLFIRQREYAKTAWLK